MLSRQEQRMPPLLGKLTKTMTLLLPERTYPQHPRTFGDFVGAPGPTPWVSG